MDMIKVSTEPYRDKVDTLHRKYENFPVSKKFLLTITRTELFETYTDAQAEIEGITRYDTFTYSFILGSALMMEILAGREEMLK